jgi:glycosyltransferase involved in cell wall biosynthesis
MKVAFWIHSLEVNSCRYRVLQYLPYFRQQGVGASIHLYQRPWLDRMKFYNTLGEYDILYVHRRLFHPLEFWYVRRRAKKIVYDFDDALMYRSSSSKNPHSPSRRMKFTIMMKGMDFVVAGNQFLRSEVLRTHSNVEVIPTSIDLSRYHVKGGFEHAGPVIVGWLGSSSTLKYLKNLLPVLEELYAQSPTFTLKIVCDQFLDSPRLPVVKKPWSAEEEEGDLQSFDIGVMPLSDDLWSRGKCGLKLLQYFSVGVPAVCTPVGINRDIVQDGVNGFWARDEGQWKDRLFTLIHDEGLRREMGVRGRKTAETGYSLEVNAPILLRVLETVSQR